MKARYDFSAATKNPYAKRLKRSVTIRLDESTVEYVRDLAAERELPYQSLINLYWRDCAASDRRLSMSWRPVRPGANVRGVSVRDGAHGNTFTKLTRCVHAVLRS